MQEDRSGPSAPQRASLGVWLAAALVLGLAAETSSAASASLRGSRVAMDRQVRAARSHDYTYIRNPTELRRFVDQGLLLRVSGGRNYELAGVSFPYARPEVLLFVERLSGQYQRACGEKLVVTSLTRPKSHQPRNASRRSVHPTGMALDLRRSRRASCRRWLESTLMTLERRNVLDATYESRPPHFHVALFPEPYQAYVEAKQTGKQVGEPSGRSDALQSGRRVRVQPGDTLWGIASRHGTTVSALRRANGLRSNRLLAGQTLQVPADS